ncbi:hypothetical protein CTAYLR_003587 [Chrysophaeum taylorii]|uniref:Uncharacterized protein n=1 Tax=Chrysophaeum taylorii TaxID=2483200 RepID=A0AAD7UL71_9STRA|nr:hypothetical protein CTAYLR_003587 [Chrysophaeum taylorii]
MAAAKRPAFRNYLPDSEDLRANFRPDNPAASKVLQQDEKDAYALELERLASETPEDPVSIVPKDPTWDLKRDLEPKLAVLAKRTQRAIVDLIRERLASDDDNTKNNNNNNKGR